MEKLTSEQIELINAHGPFNHSTWSHGDISVTNEERLSGRGEYLVGLISKAITGRFTMDEIRQMSIADIGCYDGWILHQLSDLPFKSMVGIEPRKKNIDKGIFIRDALGINSEVEFKCGDLSVLESEQFDIILCIGVIHHLESPTEALELLRKGTKKFLFLETICLSSKYMGKSFRKEIEMKDVVYNYKDKICGVSGQKYESAYYDGSTMHLSVVSIPSVESLIMSMRIKFENVTIEAGPETYRKAFVNYDRNFNAVCLSASAKSKDQTMVEKMDWINDYEKKMTTVVLKRSHVEPLYNKFVKNQRSCGRRFSVIVFSIYLSSKSFLAGVCRSILNNWYQGETKLEIIKNLKYNPPDKLSFEFGKILFQTGEFNEAITVLEGITQKLNADWRCVYRSFYLLNQIYIEVGNMEKANIYKKLCNMSNPVLFV